MAVECMQALDAMAEIQERHEAIKDLERSLVDLHQVFLDMSVLVDAQGEMLDNIQQQVWSTQACILNANSFAHHILAGFLAVFMLEFPCISHAPCNCMHGHQGTNEICVCAQAAAYVTAAALRCHPHLHSRNQQCRNASRV